MPELLTVRNLKIEATSYPPGGPPENITIVEGISFDLKKGEVLGLIGESGAGKSTIGVAALAYGRGGVRITGGEPLVRPGLADFIRGIRRHAGVIDVALTTNGVLLGRMGPTLRDAGVDRVLACGWRQFPGG